jgi:hypothetical protein
MKLSGSFVEVVRVRAAKRGASSLLHLEFSTMFVPTWPKACMRAATYRSAGIDRSGACCCCSIGGAGDVWFETHDGWWAVIASVALDGAVTAGGGLVSK